MSSILKKFFFHSIMSVSYIFLMTGCNANSKNTITIKGSIKNFSAKKVYIASAFRWDKFLDSATCINGNFEIKYKIDSSFVPFLASIGYYNAEGKLKTLHYINPFISTIEKKASDNGFVLEKSKILIEGDMLPNEELNIIAGRETEIAYQTRKTSFGYIDTRDSIKRIAIINQYISFIQKNPSSYYLFREILNNKYQYSKDELNSFFKTFNAEIQNSSLGKLMLQYLFFRAEPGKPITNLILTNIANEKKYIIDTFSKVNVLIFWASWCGPCRAEIPALKNLYEKMKGMKIRMSSISVDRDKRKWFKAVAEEKMPWEQFFIDSSASIRAEGLFNYSAIPLTIVTDNKGNELLRTTGFSEKGRDELTEFIEKYFKNK